MTYPQFNAADVVTGGSPTVSRQEVIDATRHSLMALRDDVVTGQATGWSYSRLGADLDTPFSETWTNLSNSSERLRATYLWSGYKMTIAVWAYTANNGALWEEVDTKTIGYDVNGNVASGNTGGWLWRWMLSAWSRLMTTATAYAAHAASSTAHSAGTISTQNSNAVALTGGAIDNVVIGGTTPALATTKQTREVAVANVAVGSGGTFALDWSLGGAYRLTPAGNFTIAFSSAPPASRAVVVVLEIINCVGKTITLPSGGSWGANGAPTFSANTDLITVYTSDGGATSRFSLASKG